MRTTTGRPLNGMCVVVLIMLYVTFLPVYASLPDTAGISFVSMSATSNPQGGAAVVNYDYFISTYEATVGQWNAFKADIGVPVTGSPAHAYDSEPAWSDQDMPVTNVSWYEAAQFVNWLNTSNGFAPAYNFTGTQGISGYTFSSWSLSQSMNGNLFRNKNAQYFLPTEGEWMKAAYCNGDQLQLYATPDNALPVAGSCANYGYELSQPWVVGTGRVEVNGTYDMMGNVFEWIETHSTIHISAPIQSARCEAAHSTVTTRRPWRATRRTSMGLRQVLKAPTLDFAWSPSSIRPSRR